jgi:ubiquinone/menaquinone biosynthesis C-methylase UbiE
MDALKEIARVLKPTGAFGGIWNVEDCMYFDKGG